MADVGCAGLLVSDTFCGSMPSFPPVGGLVTLEEIPVRAGGCAVNVAIDLARHGVQVDVAGCLGADVEAGVVHSALEKHGVGCSRVVSVADSSTSKTVIRLISGDDRRYMHSVGANERFTIEHISEGWLLSLKIFYLGGLFALPGINLVRVAEVLAFCRRASILTVLDVVTPEDLRGMLQLKRLLPHVDVFLPNEDEARALTGRVDPVDQLKHFAEAGANTLIITRGALGCVGKHDGRLFHCGAHTVPGVDPSGSGDAFCSGVIIDLSKGWEFPELLKFASVMGASATRGIGTTDSVFNAEEADSFIKTHSLSLIERSL